jgi:hypothetical protein
MALMTDIDVAVLCLCLMESICRFGSCYLHQNRLAGRSIYYIDGTAFVVSPAALVAAVIVVADYSSIQDNRAVLLCLRLMVSFYLFILTCNRF